MAAKTYEDVAGTEFERWLIPAEALLELKPLAPDAAAIQILEAARAGLVESAAESISRQPRNGTAAIVARLSTIPYHYWSHIADLTKSLNFWESGTVAMWLTNKAGYQLPTMFRCFQVRFKPEDIHKLKPKTPRQFGAPSTSDDPLSAEEAIRQYGYSEAAPPAPEGASADQSRPKLAPAALTAWYGAYKLAYKSSERNLDHAWAHAKASFPEKYVTRASVRALMPGGKPGPKTDDA